MRKEKKFKNNEELEELYIDEEDRIRILSLPEFERERIFAERMQKLNEEKERAALLKQKNSHEHERKKDALEDIKKRRSQMTKKQESESESGEIDDDNSLLDSDSSIEDECSLSLNMSDDEKDKKKISYNINIYELEKIKLSRSFIEKYHDLPIFDQSIQGCFVKININDGTKSNQTGYLLGQIKSVVENTERAYTFMNKKITKYLLVSHANQEKQFNYNVISNSPISESEFKVWIDRNDKHKITLPLQDEIKSIIENLNKIKNFEFTNQEIMERINKKKDMKILNKDKNINITKELSHLQEEYNAAKQQYEETKNVTFLLKMNELNPKIENLGKMAAEREQEEVNKTQIDRISQINRKILEKQKINDLNYSLIHKKRKGDELDISNPYKRKDCKPVNLFDSGYLKKDEIKIKKEDIVYVEVNEKIIEDRIDNNLLNEKIKKISNEIDDLVKLKREYSTKKNEESYLYDILNISKEKLNKMINSQNNRLMSKNYKLLSLDQIDY